MKEIFFFDSMITPKIITSVYWLSLLCVVIVGFNKPSLLALGAVVAVAVVARILCELMIVLFNINKNIEKISIPSELSGCPYCGY